MYGSPHPSNRSHESHESPRSNQESEGFWRRWSRRVGEGCDCADTCTAPCGWASDCFSLFEWSGCDSPDCNLPDCGLLRGGSVLALIALQVPQTRPRPRPGVAARAGLLLIRGYQRFLSPRLPTRCRQVPTCSRYGYLAVSRYGLLTGSRLTAGRIGRCNRATPHGTLDPVP
ncbi:membrane protein insertion efficiency factor YidD [Kineosporia sp. NBRC 101731]|uniref:membrane protein insertion efficiency factor YidD n=1 Tax=Kineosporia sp. NBRC 101731 TaxID=3032199 RepID=UPI0024A5B54A|nr:membrane protein insertion efficiency factor YidD [Kineosporia sp. NBRC 101731]GLY30528.1 hypothetical protein Kisp02_38930 [Kineosporia sp. NBRC 101731]